MSQSRQLADESNVVVCPVLPGLLKPSPATSKAQASSRETQCRVVRNTNYEHSLVLLIVYKSNPQTPAALSRRLRMRLRLRSAVLPQFSLQPLTRYLQPRVLLNAALVGLGQVSEEWILRAILYVRDQVGWALETPSPCHATIHASSPPWPKHTCWRHSSNHYAPTHLDPLQP